MRTNEKTCNWLLAMQLDYFTKIPFGVKPWSHVGFRNDIL